MSSQRKKHVLKSGWIRNQYAHSSTSVKKKRGQQELAGDNLLNSASGLRLLLRAPSTEPQEVKRSRENQLRRTEQQQERFFESTHIVRSMNLGCLSESWI